MKYILILLISFAFGQSIEFNPNYSEDGDSYISPNDIESRPFLDFTLQTPATQCFQILLEFQDGWLENMVDMRDSLICPNMIDVRIEYEGIIQDYTMDEFLERLGFKE